MSIKLVSLATVKELLEISAETRFDTLLTSLIEGISKQFETYLNRKLKKEARTKYFDTGLSVYSLEAYPVDLTQSFIITLNDVSVTINDDFYLDEDIGLIEFIGGTGTSWPRGLKVVYTGGYTETTEVLAVPDDLKHACKEQVAFEFRRRKDLGLASVSMPDGSISVHQPAEWLSNVEETLKSYRRIPL
jgi:hypothetical protein